MKGKLGFRIFFAIIVLAVFVIYSYLHFSSGWFSDDTINWGTDEWLAQRYGTESTDDAAVSATSAVVDEPAASPDVTEEPLVEEASSNGLPDVDLTSWELMLVNTDSTLDDTYEPPEIAYLDSNQCPVDSRIAEALTAFAEAARAEGLPVYLSSGYRPYSEQQYLYQRKISQGYSAEEAATIVAVPGTSEHQTGLSCDITDVYRETKDSSLEDTDTYKWLVEHCQEYGFIVRYPNDKQEITNIIYEPWHFRYVGVEAATYIMENNLCLEEFLALYE
jgi:LAS superfamily LD-carboxypeptidase LdcB